MTPPLASAHTIDRPRLVPLIDRRPVVVLAGMAGYGKSTLLAEAARRQQEHGVAIWLTLDDSDRAPVRLVSDLVTAAGMSNLEATGADLAPLRESTLRAEPLTLVDSLLEVLYDAAVPSTLVLDDLQDLTGSPASASLVDHVLRWAPANMRIAIAARVVPPLRLQRLRLDDRLAYLTHEDLAFTPEETAEAVRVAGLELDAATVESIHHTTGGWPAGVRMAVLAARQYGLRQQVPTELRRDQALAEYLATEVLASLSDDVREFVLDSTLDEQVCPSLVDSVRGTHNAEVLLEQCVADGLFLSRSNNGSEPWYSWHPLFAAHIHRRLVADHPERATAQHAAAAAWWSSVDAPTAIRHAVAAGDGGLTSGIFARHWLELFLEGREDAVLDALDQLPEQSSYSGDAHLARALLLVQQGKMDEAGFEIDTARAASGGLPTVDKAAFEDRMAVVELFRTGYGLGLSAAVEPGAALLERFGQSQRPTEPAIVASVQMFVGMGEARLQGQGGLVLEMLRSSAATAHDTGLLALELTALAESCIPAVAEGRLSEVRDLALNVLARAQERGWVGLSTIAPAVAFLGWLDYWRGNLHESRAQLERGVRVRPAQRRAGLRLDAAGDALDVDEPVGDRHVVQLGEGLLGKAGAHEHRRPVGPGQGVLRIHHRPPDQGHGFTRAALGHEQQPLQGGDHGGPHRGAAAGLDERCDLVRGSSGTADVTQGQTRLREEVQGQAAQLPVEGQHHGQAALELRS
ncbi:MAG: hypothetical protein ACTHMZ_08850 [Actinomycetes bacterium]